VTEGAQRLREHVILALDAPEPGRNAQLVQRLRHRLDWFKVGLMAFVREGPAFVETLTERGARVFLDLKFHDIPNTVAAAVGAASSLGVALCTVHAAGGEAMLSAAVEASHRRGEGRAKVLAVTLLTSVAAADASERVVAAARLALAAGCDGVVCSPREAADVRSACGASCLVVTPGIRFGQALGDQARVASPSYALAAGATHLVVGRPVFEAVDPEAALDELARDLGQG
jgi:orotidine-5'-phosphate decarboxylase